MNVPITKEPLTVFDEEEVTFFPQLESNEALRDAVHSSGYGHVVETKAQKERRQRELVEQYEHEEKKKYTFKPQLDPPSDVCQNKTHERDAAKIRETLKKQVASSGYGKRGVSQEGETPAWLKKANKKIESKKKKPTARPKPKTAPDGAPMFKPQLSRGKAARIRSEAPSSGYGRRAVRTQPKKVAKELPTFKPNLNISKRAKELRKNAPSRKYGKKTSPFRVGYAENTSGVVHEVTTTQIPKYDGRASPEDKRSAHRRMSTVSLDISQAPAEKDSNDASRENAFVLDCVKIANVDPLRAKFVAADEDPIGSVFVEPAKLPELDSKGKAMREQYMAQPSSGYGNKDGYTPTVAKLEVEGDAMRVWSADLRRWVIEPRDKTGWEWIVDDEGSRWERISEKDDGIPESLKSRPAFNSLAAMQSARREDVDAWLVDNPKPASVAVGDLTILADEDEDEVDRRVGLGDMCTMAKKLPKVPVEYYGAVRLNEAHSSGYGVRVPGWEYDASSGGRVAVRCDGNAADGSTRRVRIEKKLPHSETDMKMQALHGGASFRAGGCDKALASIPDEPIEKEIAWREGIRRQHLKDQVGSHGYGQIFPPTVPRAETPAAPIWVPSSKKPVIPEPDAYGTTALARHAVSHYGPGYDPTEYLHEDHMYEEVSSDPENSGIDENENQATGEDEDEEEIYENA